MSDEETVEQPVAADETTATQEQAGGPKRHLRKTRVGVVISNKMEKTIVVEVERRVPHPQFRKIVRLTSKFYVHDEKEEAAVGDKVQIQECRPLSKKKRWTLEKILAH